MKINKTQKVKQKIVSVCSRKYEHKTHRQGRGNQKLETHPQICSPSWQYYVLLVAFCPKVYCP